MTRINLHDVAYTAYQVPDLDLMERFLIDFGMMRAAQPAAHFICAARVQTTIFTFRVSAGSPYFSGAHSKLRAGMNWKGQRAFRARL